MGRHRPDRGRRLDWEVRDLFQWNNTPGKTPAEAERFESPSSAPHRDSTVTATDTAAFVGADTATYTPAPADDGRYLKASATYTDSFGGNQSAAETSANTRAPAPPWSAIRVKAAMRVPDLPQITDKPSPPDTT